jgi:hypothetical protein
MSKPSRKPLTLDKITTVGGLAREDAYGADHAPRFDQAETNRLFVEAGQTLRRATATLDGLQVLTILAGLEHATGLGEPPQRVSMAMVELAQALLLRSPFAGENIDRESAQLFIDALSIDFHLFLDQTAKPATDEKRQLLSRRRLQTLMVRHTFYAHHASIAFRQIGNRLKTFGHARFGMSLADASIILVSAAYWVAAKLRDSSFGAELTRWLDKGNTAFDAAWTDLFEIRADILAMAMNEIPVERVVQLLDRLSHSSGALGSSDPTHLHLDNPMWRKPFIKHEGRWFCFSPGTLFSAHLDVLAELASDISRKPGELLGKARGDALEDMVAGALEAMFPAGQLLRSVLWDDANGTAYETDGILLIDGLVLIFEAKADALSLTGRRGSSKWFEDFDDIVVKASLQSWRLEQEMRDTSRPTIELRAASGTVIVTKAHIRHVVRFGVSLERVTMASYGIEGHLRERIERAGGKPMPIFTIGDLWQVRDLVGSQGRCLHYFLRRAELERDFEFVGDELDLLAHYLRTGFVRLREPSEHHVVNLYGLSDFLRHYQKGTPHYRADVKLPKRTTAWWDKLIHDVENKQRRGWTDMAYDLLNIPLASQERFEEDIRRLRRKVRRMRGKRVCQPALMQAPCQLRPSAFVCFAMGKMTADERVGTARLHFAALHESHPDERLFLLVLDVDSERRSPVLPYYRGIGWERVVGKIEAVGDAVASGLYAEIASTDKPSDNY